MILADVDGVSVTRPERDLFRDVSFTLSTGDRLGVLGINGVGKSTLLRVLTGTHAPETGMVRRGRDVRMAVLDQRPELGDGTARDAVGDDWEAEAILERLGMGAFIDRPVASLSGGQAKRVALARALLTESDLLVLDEPTNHLDIDAIEWLERRLQTYRGGLVLVTHDRLLLDRLSSRILLLTRDGWHLDDGGYQAHLDAEAEREIKAEKDERSRRTLARQELAWLQRGAKARRRKPKSRIAGATAIIEGGPKLSTARSEALGLDSFGTPRLGDLVIDLKGVGFAYPGAEPLFMDTDLSIGPGDRLGVVGPNGAGKSTLLDVISGRATPTSGDVTTGTTVVLGYFDQLGRDLDPNKRVRELIAGDGGQLNVVQQQLLERFWFDRDAQQALVGTLSGGERRRLELLLVLASQPNVLLLDEPTNDLDLDTLRALESFLDDWSGTLIAVSHDRVFLERATDVAVAVVDGAVHRLGTGETVWQIPAKGTSARPAGASGAAQPSTSAADGTKKRSPSTIRRLIGQVETTMAKLERAKSALEVDLVAAGSDHVQLASIGADIASVQADIDAAEEQWLELSTELDDR
jgi:ABC transport system ATP-binding/permease protein